MSDNRIFFLEVEYVGNHPKRLNALTTRNINGQFKGNAAVKLVDATHRSVFLTFSDDEDNDEYYKGNIHVEGVRNVTKIDVFYPGDSRRKYPLVKIEMDKDDAKKMIKNAVQQHYLNNVTYPNYTIGVDPYRNRTGNSSANTADMKPKKKKYDQLLLLL